jgi:hypothetical protein
LHAGLAVHAPKCQWGSSEASLAQRMPFGRPPYAVHGLKTKAGGLLEALGLEVWAGACRQLWLPHEVIADAECLVTVVIARFDTW